MEREPTNGTYRTGQSPGTGLGEERGLEGGRKSLVVVTIQPGAVVGETGTLTPSLTRVPLLECDAGQTRGPLPARVPVAVHGTRRAVAVGEGQVAPR